MDMSALIEKLFTFLVLMVIGYVLARRGVLDRKFTKTLSSLTINIFLCASVLSSGMSMDTSLSLSELGRLLLLMFAMQWIGYGVGALAGRLLPADREHRPVLELLMCMNNPMFIALPLVDGLFGAKGVFYVALSCIPFNLTLYTYGVLRLKSGSSDRKLHLKDMISGPLIATLLSLLIILLRLPVPGALRSLVGSVAGATMPLSMLMIGATMGSVDIFEAFRRWHLYAASFVRLLLVPVLTWLVLRGFCAYDPVLLMTIVILAASPSAVILTVMCIQYERDAVFSSEGILQSTVLSLLTIPLVVWLLG